MQWNLLGCASCCSSLWTGLIKPLWEQKIVRHYLQEESVGTGRAVIIGCEVPLDSNRQESREFTCRMGWKSCLNTQSGYFSVLPAHLSALQTCYRKGCFLCLPCFILFFLLVFYLKMLNVSVSHLMVKIKGTPDVDVIMLQCCLHLNRSCKSPAVYQSGLLLWNSCFPKGICDHLHIFNDKMSLGCFITSRPKQFLISVNLVVLLVLTKLNALFPQHVGSICLEDCRDCHSLFEAKVNCAALFRSRRWQFMCCGIF